MIRSRNLDLHPIRPLSCPAKADTLNVLKIAPTCFFADYGCHVRIFEETRALQRLGCSVTICTYHNGRDLPGIDIRRMPGVPWHAEVRVGSHYHKLYFDALLAATAAVVALRQRPQLVHAHLHEGALIGFLISRLLGVPLVFDYQGSLTREMVDHTFLAPQSRWMGLLRRLEEWINRRADVIIASSLNAAATLRTESAVHPGRVLTIADAVDTEFFRPARQSADGHTVTPEAVAALRARLAIPAERQVVVFIGLLAEYQGVGLLLHGARQLVDRRPATHFVVMGYPGLERYRRLAYDLQLLDHVTFTGRVPYELAPLHLALGDVGVSPKLSETEGNGKLLNYMAMGLPTVAFDTPVSREILGHLGCYAERGSAPSLAAAIESLLDDTDRRQDLAQALRARAERDFTWQAAGKRLMEVYHSLLAEGGARLPQSAAEIVSPDADRA